MDDEDKGAIVALSCADGLGVERVPCALGSWRYCCGPAAWAGSQGAWMQFGSFFVEFSFQSRATPPANFGYRLEAS